MSSGGGLGAGAAAEGAGAEHGHDYYEFDPETHVVRYTPQQLPIAAIEATGIEYRVVRNRKWVTLTSDGFGVIQATIALMAWISRTGVAVQTSGRPFKVEAAKGALVIVADAQQVWR